VPSCGSFSLHTRLQSSAFVHLIFLYLVFISLYLAHLLLFDLLCDLISVLAPLSGTCYSSGWFGSGFVFIPPHGPCAPAPSPTPCTHSPTPHPTLFAPAHTAPTHLYTPFTHFHWTAKGGQRRQRRRLPTWRGLRRRGSTFRCIWRNFHAPPSRCKTAWLEDNVKKRNNKDDRFGCRVGESSASAVCACWPFATLSVTIAINMALYM